MEIRICARNPTKYLASSNGRKSQGRPRPQNKAVLAPFLSNLPFHQQVKGTLGGREFEINVRKGAAQATPGLVPVEQ
jgi:hypothetical protein